MKKSLLAAMVFCSMLTLVIQAHALPIQITPSGQGLVLTGDQTAQPQIDVAIKSTLGLATELYKQNVGGSEEKSLAGSYETLFFATPNDPSGATITWVAGMPIIGDPKFMLVKDGNQTPAWYLFNLSTFWDGMETLELSGFWPKQGAISHISLYGVDPPPIPEPSTLILLGAGLVGLAYARRSRKK